MTLKQPGLKASLCVITGLPSCHSECCFIQNSVAKQHRTESHPLCIWRWSVRVCMSRVNYKIVKFLRTCWDVSVRSRSNWNLEVLVFKKRTNWSTRGKSFRSIIGENPKQTQPTYGADAGILCSHHCPTLAPPFKFNRNSFLVDTSRFSVDIWAKTELDSLLS